MKLADRVAFMGRVDDPFPWYRSAIALVHPARFEGMPNAVLEAMSEGLPPIVSDAQEGLRGIVQDGQSGLVVAVESATELASAMRKLMDDPATAKPALIRREGQRGSAALRRAGEMDGRRISQAGGPGLPNTGGAAMSRRVSGQFRRKNISVNE